MTLRIRRHRGLLAVLLTLAATSVSTFAFGATAQADWGNTHVIINYKSGKCLQPQSTSANALVVQRSCTNTSLQKWQAMNVGTGYFWLQNRASGLCMDLQVNSEPEVVPGALVQQFPCNTIYTSEEWNRSSGSRLHHFQVWTRIRGLCLEPQNRSTSDGVRIHVNSCSYYENAQQFRFVDV